MTTEADKYTKMLAELFCEYMKKTEVEWDSSYFRYVEYNVDHRSSEWSFIFNSQVTLVKVPDDILEPYFDAFEGLCQEIISLTGHYSGKEGVVLVLELDRAMNYKVTFSYGDSNANDISKMSIGDANSYFKEQAGIA